MIQSNKKSRIAIVCVVVALSENACLVEGARLCLIAGNLESAHHSCSVHIMECALHIVRCSRFLNLPTDQLINQSINRSTSSLRGKVELESSLCELVFSAQRLAVYLPSSCSSDVPKMTLTPEQQLQIERNRLAALERLEKAKERKRLEAQQQQPQNPQQQQPRAPAHASLHFGSSTVRLSSTGSSEFLPSRHFSQSSQQPRPQQPNGFTARPAGHQNRFTQNLASEFAFRLRDRFSY